MALFITCLFDLTKFRDEYAFPNVKVIFEPNKRIAHRIAQKLACEDYTYISFTPSLYNHELSRSLTEVIVT